MVCAILSTVCSSIFYCKTICIFVSVYILFSGDKYCFTHTHTHTHTHIISRCKFRVSYHIILYYIIYYILYIILHVLYRVILYCIVCVALYRTVLYWVLAYLFSGLLDANPFWRGGLFQILKAKDGVIALF